MYGVGEGGSCIVCPTYLTSDVDIAVTSYNAFDVLEKNAGLSIDYFHEISVRLLPRVMEASLTNDLTSNQDKGRLSHIGPSITRIQPTRTTISIHVKTEIIPA